jgi:hypothetical protein
MKPNIVDAPERNARAGEKWIVPKSQLTMLLLVCVALAVGGCETLESSNPGQPVATTSFSSSAAIGQPAYTGDPGFASGLNGRWYHDNQPTSISVEADGRNLMLINEHGQRSSGYANSPYELEIPSLRIKGHVSHGGRRISWTNGTEWTREPREHGSDSGQAPGQDISGRWFHDGKPTSISVSFGGRHVTITNEQGQSSSGRMAGDREIEITGGLRGRVSHGGRRISWSNGTEWTR